MDFECIEKTILKRSDQKNKKKKTENQCQNAACEQKNRIVRNENLIQTKN